MRNALSSFLLILAIVSSSCKSAQSGSTASTASGGSNSSEAGEQQDRVKSWTRDEAAKGPAQFRLVVSLISIGEGTDPEGMRMVERYVADFENLSGKQISWVMIPWGREGEVDCCFSLSELNPAMQSQFIEGMKERFKGRNLLQINENAKNRFR
jgi:hypothetical protein